MSTKFIIAVLLALAIGYLLLKKRGDVSGSDARALVEAGARLVDVRTPQEFAAGHLPGAVNIPVEEIQGRTKELAGKDQPIVLYCRSGARSGNAARILKTAGYSKVHDLGAMSRW